MQNLIVGHQYRAEQLPGGACFRNPMGHTVYRVISQGAVSHYNMGQRGIFGVAANGNMTRIPREKKVIFCDPPELLTCPDAPDTANSREGLPASNRNGQDPPCDPTSGMPTRDALARYRELFRAISAKVGLKKTSQKIKCQQLGEITKMVKELMVKPERRSGQQNRRGN